jgi:hypothetical protein
MEAPAGRIEQCTNGHLLCAEAGQGDARAGAQGSRPEVPRVSPRPAGERDSSAKCGAEHSRLAGNMPPLLEHHDEGDAGGARGGVSPSACCLHG